MDPNLERFRTLNTYKIPVSKNLEVKVGREKKEVSISSGKVLPKSGPGKSVVHFVVKNSKPVKVSIKDKEGAKGVWLNAFELKQAWPLNTGIFLIVLKPEGSPIFQRKPGIDVQACFTQETSQCFLNAN